MADHGCQQSACSKRLPYLLGTPLVVHLRPSGPLTSRGEMDTPPGGAISPMGISMEFIVFLISLDFS
jgi:hypothetical protein